jgi:DNA modification methylase
MRNTIIQGEALAVLKTLPDKIVQCCITSPPYYGLRSYLPDGHDDKHLEIGLEDTPEAYIARLVEVFHEVRRVLRDDGTLWCNIGDSYAGSWGNYAPGGIKGVQRSRSEEGERWERKAYQDTTFLPPTARVKGLKPKDLMMIPARLAIALQSDGWYLRSDIIWVKPSAMPESVTDRPTSAHEHIFLLAKNERYFYDAAAIAEPAIRSGDIGSFGGAKGRNHITPVHDPNYRNGHEQWGRMIETGATRNKRNVWTVATKPYSESHFAVFPPKLIEPCILAGSSPRACEQCGAPWERVTDREPEFTARRQYESGLRGRRTGAAIDSDYRGIGISRSNTTGWQRTCTHDNEGTAKCIVLDPFFGSGTVGEVSNRLGRDWLGIELNPAYIKLAEVRTAQQGLWTPESEAV